MNRFVDGEVKRCRDALAAVPDLDTCDRLDLIKSHARLQTVLEGLLSQLPDETPADVVDIAVQVAMEDGIQPAGPRRAA
jgi:hypothetical protein